MNDNKRILYNTAVIYVKLILSAAIGLYTSRVILRALGADDYGLYSVVGGIVTFLNVIGTTMVSVSNRYIAIEIGKRDNGDPNRIFNTVLIIHVFLAICLLIIGGAIGSFYVINILNVLPGKTPDALFVLYVSLLTTALSIITVPYHGLIIAREKFTFASIIEVGALLIKLGLVLLLAVSDGNRLRLFTLIMAFVTVFTQVAYQGYCFIKERNIIKWRVNRQRQDYKSVFGFAGWSLFGAVAFIGKEQGAAMIINYFFGTILNAAFGLASQINRYAMMFTKGLSQAAVPQIMKSYGSGDSNRSLNLVYTISRISTLIMFLIALPLILCMDDILVLWLETPPEYTTIFSSFMLINAVVTMLGAGFDACIQSTGNVKKNEIYASIIYLSLLPIIFVLYKAGMPPYMNVVLLPVLSLAIRVMQLFIMRELTSFEIKIYFRRTLLPCAEVMLFATLPLVFIRLLLDHSLFHTAVLLFTSIVWIVVSIYIWGISKEERSKILSFVKSKI